MDATYPTCLDTADDATACAFFWTGVALGILHVDASKGMGIRQDRRAGRADHRDHRG
ncbi:hypothetical protein AB8E26_07400 [Stenotrophomonas rhizophila]|jgi:hypothetical protein|uniref:hypothetical protein n=1 Tax=Stenotrophomonas rhizophila TaxID=216778 RepID=UPI003511FD18